MQCPHTHTQKIEHWSNNPTQPGCICAPMSERQNWAGSTRPLNSALLHQPSPPHMLLHTAAQLHRTCRLRCPGRADSQHPLSSHPAPGCGPAVTVQVSGPAPPQMQCALHINTRNRAGRSVWLSCATGCQAPLHHPHHAQHPATTCPPAVEQPTHSPAVDELVEVQCDVAHPVCIKRVEGGCCAAHEQSERQELRQLQGAAARRVKPVEQHPQRRRVQPVSCSSGSIRAGN